MTIDTITREALVEKLKQYPTLLQQFLVLVDTQGTTLDDIQEILKLAEEAESNAVKAQTNATIAQEEAEKASTSASKVDAFDERIINLENSTAKVKEENTFTQVNNFNSGIKTDKFKTSGGLDIINHDGTNINIGNSSKTLKLTGTQSRPTYKEQDLALLTDVNSSLTTAIRYTDTETTERKAQDTALQTNINSNWSTLMANLGIGRWANQTLYTQYNWTNTIYDDLMPQYTSYARTFANSEFKAFEGNTGYVSDTKFSCQFKSPKDNKKSFMGTFYNTSFNKGMVIDLKQQDLFMGDSEFTFMLTNATSITFTNGTAYFGSMFNTFNSCSNLESIDGIDFTYQSFLYNGAYQAFRNSPKLKHLGIKHIHLGMDISSSTAFEESDLVEIISNLDEVSTTQTLTMGATNLAKLTDDEKKVATDKGWVLA